MKVELGFCGLLLWWSVEILLRRWVWNQVPTQVSAFTVYAVLAANAFFIAYRLRQRRRPT